MDSEMVITSKVIFYHLTAKFVVWSVITDFRLVSLVITSVSNDNHCINSPGGYVFLLWTLQLKTFWWFTTGFIAMYAT